MSRVMTPPTKRRRRDPVAQIDDLLARAGEDINEPAIHQFVYEIVLVACGGDEERARAEISRLFALTRRQRNELLEVLTKLKEQPVELCWVWCPPFDVGSNGSAVRYVHASPFGAGRGASPDLCAVLDEPSEEEEEAEEPEPFPEEFPFLAWRTKGEPRIYLGTAPVSVLPPTGTELLEAVSVPESPFPRIREIELSDSANQKVTVPAVPGLAEEVDRLIEEGEEAIVRVVGGMATAVYQHSERSQEDWLEFHEDGPGMESLILPKWLTDEFRRDARVLAKGKSFFLDLVGPTGVGKSAACPRAGIEAVRLAREQGRDVKGLAMIHLCASRIGSSLIYQVSRTIGRALKKAESLAKKGWICVVLLDESDALTGESGAGLEHSYVREARLTLQSELSRTIPGVGIYSTRNVRRNSTIPAAIARRAQLRVFPRATLSQIAAIAALYISDEALEALRMTGSEFGGVFADRLFRDRVVAEVHLHSGAVREVMARDLMIVSGGKVESLINAFNEDVELGEPAELTRLWRTMDREIRAPDLTPENLFELTFLTPPDHDTVRTVVPVL